MTAVVICPRCGQPKKLRTKHPHALALSAQRMCRTCHNQDLAEASHQRAQQLRAETMEDIDFLIEAGEPPRSITRRLGVTASTLVKRCERGNRPDLTRVFRRLAEAERTERKRAA